MQQDGKSKDEEVKGLIRRLGQEKRERRELRVRSQIEQAEAV